MTAFTVYTEKNAPEKSRDILKAVQSKMGFIPNALGTMAESPALLKGYWELSSARSWGSFSPAETEVVQLTVSFMNDCSYCMAAHTAIGEKNNVSRDILEDLRKDRPLKDQKLEALRIFTRNVMKKLGRAEDRDLEAFFKAGYNKAHVMEVVLNVSQAIMTNYLNHIASTPLDKAFETHRFESKKHSGKSSHAA